MQTYGELGQDEIFAPKCHEDYLSTDASKFEKTTLKQMIEKSIKNNLTKDDITAKESTAKNIEKLIQDAKSNENQEPKEAFRLYKKVSVMIEENENHRKFKDKMLANIKLFARKKLHEQSSKEDLELALDFMDLVYKYAIIPKEEEYFRNEEDFIEFCDIEVGLLIKLGRTDESYELVVKVLKYDSELFNYENLKTISKSNKFKKYHASKPVKIGKKKKLFLQKAKRILQNIPDSIISKNVDKNNTNITYKVLSQDKAIKKYNFMNVKLESSKVLVIFGDFYSDEMICHEWLKQKGEEFGEYIDSAMFMNDLHVNSSIDNADILLQINGNLYIEDIICSSNGVLQVLGNAHVKYGIYGYGNDGFVNVKGKLHTSFLITDDHDMPRVCEQESIFIQSSDNKYNIAIAKDEENDYFTNSHLLFNPKVWNDEDEFCVDSFFEFVRCGKGPFI